MRSISMFLDGLLSNLSEDIKVEITPDYFYFRRRGRENRIKTTVCLSSDGKHKILGFGDSDMPSQPHIIVELFKSESSSIRSFDKYECLSEYFEHGIRGLMSRTDIIRPRIVFSNHESLKGILCGYEKMILKRASIDAGARGCLFKE
jgi:hypothetical protein